MKLLISHHPVHVPVLLAVLLLLQACSTNPVTGRSELSLVSTDQEIAIGREKYSPYRQAQGGDYNVDPGVVEYVQQVGQRLANVSDRELPYEFSVINDSSPNAWALPGGKIAINRGLLTELDNEAQLAAVLGHEIVHAAARHTAHGIQRGLLLQGALIASSVALSDSEYRQLGMLGTQLGAVAINQKYGRDAEREADLYGMRYMQRAGYDPAAAVDLQKTFLRLAGNKESNWLAGLFASHPPSRERVNNNLETLQALQPGDGEIAEQRYRQALATLFNDKPAYAAYDDAVETFREASQPEKALKLVNRAISLQPKESLFYGLRGEIRSELGEQRSAKTDYDRAVSLNPGYFRHYLGRGFVQRDLNDSQAATADFRRSNELLPTSEAHYGLGAIALKSGDKSQAISHFRVASQAQSEVGQTAALQLARLDLPDNPHRYLQTRLTLDSAGFLHISISNNSRVSVDNVRVSYGLKSGPALFEQGSFLLRQPLPAGRGIDVRTPVGPVQPAQLGSYAARITHAEIHQ